MSLSTHRLGYLIGSCVLLLLLNSGAMAIPFSRLIRRGQNHNKLMSNQTRHQQGNKVLLHHELMNEPLRRRIRFFPTWRPKRQSVTQLSSSTVIDSNSSDGTTQHQIEEQQQQQQPSVHLQLGSEAMMAQVEGEEEPEEEEEEKTKKKKSKLLSYQNPRNKVTFSGLNVSRRRFQAWLDYTVGGPNYKVNDKHITEEEIEISIEKREELRNKWRSRQLLSDRTELLTVYNSDTAKEEDEEANSNTQERRKRRGGFADLLHLYADRFYGILLDEQQETRESMRAWLFQNYGMDETARLEAPFFRSQTKDEQDVILQHFLDWFRTNFPYFYDRCDTCGASFKDDPRDDDDDDKDDEGTFLGYVFPSEHELTGKAGRTELYQCHKCHSFIRFPRFNKSASILASHRGRCGEYSMLIYRMLRALNHEARWIVDWADHVWAEVLLNGEWIHLDPCEAAMDNPLLYQGWGKQQTYIVGFYAPLETNGFGACLHPIEDLTTKYTSDPISVIQKRRDESPEELQTAVMGVAAQLTNRVADITSSID